MTPTTGTVFSYLTAIAQQHALVKNWNWSEPEWILSQWDLTYPFVFYSPLNYRIEQGLTTITVQMVVMDLLRSDESNLNYLWSDTFEITHDIISKIDYDGIYWITTSSVEPFKSKRQNDSVAGQIATFQLTLQKPMNSCNYVN